jgi:hypothetical protein
LQRREKPLGEGDAHLVAIDGEGQRSSAALPEGRRAAIGERLEDAIPLEIRARLGRARLIVQLR